MLRAMLLLMLLLFASSVSAEKRINFGGSNHFLYAYGTADGWNTNNSWYIPSRNFRPVVGLYHIQPKLVQEQIEAMHKSGQTAYNIIIAHLDVSFAQDFVWGYVHDNSLSSMRPQHRSNLKQVIGLALANSFERIFIRFCENDAPESWGGWNETRYQKVWNYILDTRNAAREAVVEAGAGSQLTGPRPLLMFDLSCEGGGIDTPMNRAFNDRLWVDYTSTFGVDDTIGFSFAWAPGRFTTQRGWFEALGIMPKYWAYDIYGNVDTALSSIYNEMGSLRNQPIIIMETFHNYAPTRVEIEQALTQHPLLNIDSLTHWPLAGFSGDGHFTQLIVDQLISLDNVFHNYSPMLARRRVSFTSSNADILGVYDTNCGTTTTWPCTIGLVWGPPPSGKSYGIYIQTVAGTSLVHCDYNPGSTTINWISVYPEYKFTVYEGVGACGHLNPNPGSILRATAVVTP